MPQTPQMHPLPLKASGDRTSSAKRQISGSSPIGTPTQNKKPRTSLQQTTPVKTSGAEPATMERKDGLQNTAACPATSIEEPTIDTFVSKTLAAWKVCKGNPGSHLQKELNREVQASKQHLDAAHTFLKKMERLSDDLEAAIANAGGLNEGKHKLVKDGWYMTSKQHAQLAYEENNRCSKAHEKAMKDRADALTLENGLKKKVEDVKEERKQLEKFGEFMSVYPSSTGA
ncbi:unnamed protein product [Aureobasidium vineae]|uniref:Uncharacterized protein n=1 Tax=Aureobasidium vineae TaxID=2773715 RepID=A0A9N8P6L2_9PEZI|nr:unnamed protein product [Aureobasidium vineae]